MLRMMLMFLARGYLCRYDLDDSLLSEASSVLQGKGEQLSKVKEFSDLENTLSLAVKVWGWLFSLWHPLSPH